MRTLTWSEDGSPTLYSSTFGETYHSDSGAVEESLHVFLRAGLEYRIQAWHAAEPDSDTIGSRQDRLHVVEYGFGTGLNVLLTLDWYQRRRKSGLPTPEIFFQTLEKYPLVEEEYRHLQFPASEHLQEPNRLLDLHQAPWHQVVEIVPGFYLLKEEQDFLNVTPLDLTQGGKQPLDVIFFDAFSPGSQPELWERPVFEVLASAAAPNCVLVTYSARGSVKQALRDAGFSVKRLPGFGRKRHMVRAINLR